MANDITIVAVLFTFFVIVGFSIPFVDSELGSTTTINDPTTTIGTTLESESQGASTVTVVDVIISLLSVFVWSVSGIPVWLNTILLIPRVIFVLVIARNIWIGGGS